MNLNVFASGTAVKSALEKPNIGTAVVLVLLPTIVSIVAGMVFQLNLLPGLIILSIAKNFATLLLMAIVLYVIAGLVKGFGTVKGKFNGIVSAISLVYVIVLILTIFSFIATPMFFSNQVFKLIKQTQNGEISATTAIERFDSVSEKPAAINFPILIAAIAIGVIIALWGLLLLYKIASELLAMKGLRNFIAFIAWLAITGLILLVLFPGIESITL